MRTGCGIIWEVQDCEFLLDLADGSRRDVLGNTCDWDGHGLKRGYTCVRHTGLYKVTLLCMDRYFNESDDSASEPFISLMRRN